ncbi:MAG: DUF2752 domain-containing protein [Ignavibacteriae bacterium]|nr:DUF2752 domain-containing protein [Ignavibacteriota bacterium]
MLSSYSIRRQYFVGFAVISVGVSLLAIIPTEVLQTLPTVCVFKNLFGVECFGCGVTRAISSVLHGEFQQAWLFNKFIVTIFPLLVFYLTYSYFKSKPNKNITSLRMTPDQ